MEIPKRVAASVVPTNINKTIAIVATVYQKGGGRRTILRGKATAPQIVRAARLKFIYYLLSKNIAGRTVPESDELAFQGGDGGKTSPKSDRFSFLELAPWRFSKKTAPESDELAFQGGDRLRFPKKTVPVREGMN